MKNLMKIFLLAVVSMSLQHCTPLHAHGSHYNWTVLGQRTVDLHGDHDVIKVSKWHNGYTKLRFKVQKSSIYIRNVRIIYANGQSENHRIDKRFQAGDYSSILDLSGDHRVITEIVLNYDTVNNSRGKALVTALGRH